MQIPLEQLKVLLQTLEDGGVSEFEYQDDSYRVRVALGSNQVVATAAPVPASPSPQASAAPATSTTEEAEGVVYVTSPFVGTFYRASAPDASPFVEVGSQVKKGQALCIVEAMKLMNEIEAEIDGSISEVLVQNGESVEFGQRLFKLQKL